MRDAAIVACGSYENKTVEAAVARAVALIGGFEALVRPGMRVYIKANLMRRSTPEQCAVTHPAVIRAAAKLLSGAGAIVTIGDSPGGVYNKATLHGIYAATGLAAAVADLPNVSLNEDCREVTVPVPGGKAIRELTATAPVLEADLVVNIAKFKSHTLTVFSGAAKNLYGIVPGLLKAEMHFRFQNIADFSDMLVDICELVAPQINIIDAIDGMEGEGPGSGDPRHIGALIASRSPYSTDMAAVSLAGFREDEIPLLAAARRRGLIDGSLSTVGDDPERFAIKDFVRATDSGNHLLRHRVPKLLVGPLEKWFAVKPIVVRSRCVGCGICQNTCPAGAAVVSGKKASIAHSKCIKCFCCMEFCPKKAIVARRPWVFRLAIRFTGQKKS